jgi:hypothetical protein
MARKGRKPLGAAHVEHLDGSPLAKQRLTLILQTMRGELTVSEACRALSVCQSRFHALRNQWLQEALELLEPRRAGRPPKIPETPTAEQLSAVVTENQQLRQQVMAAEVRERLARVMPSVLKDAAVKKKRRVCSARRKRRKPR